MDPKLIMGKIFSFVQENYNKGKKIANHATWTVLLFFGIVAKMIIDGDIDFENYKMLTGWVSSFETYFWAILGGRVVGGGWKGYVEHKHGNRKEPKK